MFRRIWALILALVLVAAVVAGCGGTQTQNVQPTPNPAAGSETKTPPPAAESKKTTYPITVKDAAGRDVTIKEEPKRVVSVAPSNTELLFAIGKGNVLVGRSDFDDYPPEVTKVESVGGFFPPNYEKIVAAKPDLLLMIGGSVEARDKLVNEYKINVFVLDPKTFDEMYAGIKTLGVVMNAQENAEKLVADIQRQVKEITDKTAKAATKPKVFYELSAEPQIWTAGTGTFMDDLIKLAGGQNAIADAQGWTNVTMETLAAANPDVIITNNGGAAATTTRTGWAGIKAVKETKVFELADNNHVQRPGPRLVLGLKFLAETLHPELFGK